MKSIYYKSFILLLIFSFVLAPFSTFAGEFNPEHILSDKDILDYKAMDHVDIQNFLESKNSYLSTYSAKDIVGMPKSASQIIYEASRNYLINPKYILTLLQKEQSLVTRSAPSKKSLDWATGYAVCDDCSMNDPKVIKFKGFGKQVDRATWLTRYYMSFPDEANYYAGRRSVIDGSYVVPSNNATAVLYTYTPHYQGNENLWSIWNNWYSTKYPDGSLIKADDSPGVFYIQNGKKRPITSKAVLISRFNEEDILIVSQSDIESFEQGPALKYTNYSLLETENGNVYLLVDDELRLIETQEVFRLIGFNPEEVELITNTDFNTYALGDPITISSSHPLGALLQNNVTGGVYYVKDGVKYPIWSKVMMLHNYPTMKIRPVSADELDTFPTGSPTKFYDGTLLTVDEKTIFVISNGVRRQIDNDVFDVLGYDSEKIITVNEKVLAIHPIGEPITSSDSGSSIATE